MKKNVTDFQKGKGTQSYRAAPVEFEAQGCLQTILDVQGSGLNETQHADWPDWKFKT